MLKHWIAISAAGTNMDDFDRILRPVKKIVPDNSTISFATNMDNAKDIYYKAQFVMVPKVVTWDLENDTVLIIEDATRESIRIGMADTLCELSDHNVHIILLRK